ncbi:unnamed protein product, partial [marine sediment metagenome]
GGRVLADWPGLAQGSLYQGRDLAPTTELDGLIAAAAAQSFGLDGERVARTLFGRGRGDGRGGEGGQGGMLGGLLRA